MRNPGSVAILNHCIAELEDMRARDPKFKAESEAARNRRASKAGAAAAARRKANEEA